MVCVHLCVCVCVYSFMQCLFEFLPVFNCIVPQSIRAAIIKCYILGSLKKKETFFTVLQAGKSKIMVPAWSLSSWLDPPISASSSHCLLLCLYVWNLPLVRIHVMAFRAHLDNLKYSPQMEILTITSARTLSLIKVTFTNPKNSDLIYTQVSL